MNAVHQTLAYDLGRRLERFESDMQAAARKAQRTEREKGRQELTLRSLKNQLDRIERKLDKALRVKKEGE